jgi:hypothetical protein
VWISWALLDRPTGALTHSANAAEATPTASMIKAWIVADHLRLFGPDARLSPIIRDSANQPAWDIYAKLGREASIARLIATCELAHSSPGEDLSMTLMSALDTVRMGRCIAEGAAAGPKWTPWLLDEMRAVHGTGDFGIRQAFPPHERERIAIKNGWEIRNAVDEWNVNCLAINDAWIMAVLMRYPSSLPLSHGAERCTALTRKLICST